MCGGRLFKKLFLLQTRFPWPAEDDFIRFWGGGRATGGGEWRGPPRAREKRSNHLFCIPLNFFQH